MGDNAIASSEGQASQLHHPHFPAKAKRVIFLFMSGGPSHVDTFDPKPKLQDAQWKTTPVRKAKTRTHRNWQPLWVPYQFVKHGQSGTEVSELFPHRSTCVDDMCVIRSMVADKHQPQWRLSSTGNTLANRPSPALRWESGSLWTGSENRNLPGFVVLSPAQPAQGAPLWSSSFLSAEYQGTLVNNLNKPVDNLDNSLVRLRATHPAPPWLKHLNESHASAREETSV